MKTVINNCHVLTMADKESVRKESHIGIVDGKILFIGDMPSDFKADKVIDGKNTIALPGLINAHTHTGMSIFRNFADDLPLFPWLHKIWPLEDKLLPEDIYWSSLLSISEMIRGGTTCFHDMYFMIDETFRAIDESGIRGHLSVAFTGEEIDHNKLQAARKMYETFHGSSQERAAVTLAPHAPYTVGPSFMRGISELAEDLGARIHTHLNETQKEVEDSFAKWGKSPIEHVRDLGLFENPTIAAHCVVVDEKDREILKEHNVYVVHNPGSNLKLASGIALAWPMIQQGISVALGTDGSSSNNNLNMFEEIQLGAMLGKVACQDATAMPAFEAIKMATVTGAKALGIEEKVGTLEVGKNADIILVDLTSPHSYPRHNLISALAYGTQASDVKTVMVDGNILLDNFEFTTLDFEKVAWYTQRCADNLIKR